MVLIFVASLNENMKLANVVQEQLTSLGIKNQIINLVELALPMYDSDKESKDGIPKKALDLIPPMEQAHAYVVISPEYNFSLPPVLVNFVAWISRSGDDFRKLFTLKTIQLATHSGGGGSNVTQAMRNQFTNLGAIVMPREIITTYQKPLDKSSSEKILSQFVSVLNKQF